MTEPVYSPDGKFMWSGSEWIPAPPKGIQTLNMQDSVVGGDVWKGSWWDGLIREIRGDKYLIHYIGFDSSWDELVDNSRIKNL